MDTSGINQALATLGAGGSVSSSTTSPISQITPYNPANFSNPDLQPMLKAAYAALTPYYTQLLQEANGDTNLAMQNLQIAHDTGTRENDQALATTTANTNADLTASLASLGITFNKENIAQKDSLNQRGIAVTQNDQGGLTYAGGGEAATEVGQTASDQQLRQEAVNRNAQQAITGATTSHANTQTAIDTSLQTGQEGVLTTARDKGEQLQSQIEGQTLSMATQQQQQQQAAQTAATQAAQFKQAASAGGGGTSGAGLTDAQKHTNPKTGVWDDNYYAKTYG